MSNWRQRVLFSGWRARWHRAECGCFTRGRYIHQILLVAQHDCDRDDRGP